MVVHVQILLHMMSMRLKGGSLCSGIGREILASLYCIIYAFLSGNSVWFYKEMEGSPHNPKQGSRKRWNEETKTLKETLNL